MAQQLIVEGKDAVFIAALCRKRKLPPPKGYANPLKFKSEFAIEAGGIEAALFAFREGLANPALTNLGLVVDADDHAAARWQRILSLLREHLPGFDGSSADLGEEGWVYHLVGDSITIQEKRFAYHMRESLTIGVWIMPDNRSPGHLEHFVASLTPQEDPLWQHSQKTVEDLSTKDFCRFPQSKSQKALVHTWLAWQENPGLPFGTAVEAGFLDARSPTADAFVRWMERVFELES